MLVFTKHKAICEQLNAQPTFSICIYILVRVAGKENLINFKNVTIIITASTKCGSAMVQVTYTAYPPTSTKTLNQGTFNVFLLKHKQRFGSLKNFVNVHKTGQLKVLSPGEPMHCPVQHSGLLQYSSAWKREEEQCDSGVILYFLFFHVT